MLVLAVGVLALAVGMLQGSAFGGNGSLRVSSVKPAKADVGTDVLIKGANFAGVTDVKFHGNAAVFTVVSNSKIRATVPGDATSGSVSVGTATQTATKQNAFKVLFDAPFASCLTSGNANVPAGTATLEPDGL
jgi:IPT/TIG domain